MHHKQVSNLPLLAATGRCSQELFTWTELELHGGGQDLVRCLRAPHFFLLHLLASTTPSVSPLFLASQLQKDSP
jgi:hypothetical protein